MQSAMTAIAWELWARSRAGRTAIVTGVCLFALISNLAGVNKAKSGLYNEVVFVWSIILFAVSTLYIASVVIYSDLTQGKLFSGYPKRMFTLPISTSRLVFWPMFYGVTALTILWLAMTLLIWIPMGTSVQWWVLPLLALAMVWLQAISWTVPGSGWNRVIAASIILPTLKFALELLALLVTWCGDRTSSLDRDDIISNRWLILLIYCCTVLPLGYAVAVFGVRRARCGRQVELPWSGNWFAQVTSIENCKRQFSSPQKAQLWLEFRRTGMAMPLFIIGYLVFVSIVVVPFTSATEHLKVLVLLVGLLPWFALLAGYLMGKNGKWGGDLTMTSFHATRPLSSSSLATAKVHAAAMSALLTSTLLILIAPLWLWCCGSFETVVNMVKPHIVQYTAYELVAFVAIILMGMSALIFGHLISVMTLTITGRGWIVNIGVLLYIMLMSLSILIFRSVDLQSGDFDLLMSTASWRVIVLIAFKASVAIGVLVDGYRMGLMNIRDTVGHLGIWLLGVASLCALATLLTESDGPFMATSAGRLAIQVSFGHLFIWSLLATPMVTLFAASRALHANRVR